MTVVVVVHEVSTRTLSGGSTVVVVTAVWGRAAAST
jgi:hypothetical protein